MTSPLDALASSPAPPTRRHCVLTLACVTGARCACACDACAAVRAELLSVPPPSARDPWVTSAPENDVPAQVASIAHRLEALERAVALARGQVLGALGAELADVAELAAAIRVDLAELARLATLGHQLEAMRP